MKPCKYKDHSWTRTKATILWRGMRARCIKNGAQQRRNPMCIDSTLSQEFFSFEGFYCWYMEQPAFNLDGYEVDKDLIRRGNKHYSRETCFLLPKALNLFFSTKSAAKSGLLTGVRKTPSGSFHARIRINGKSQHVGSYETEMAAHSAYINAKNNETRRWVSRLESGEFLVCREAIELIRNTNWENRYGQ